MSNKALTDILLFLGENGATLKFTPALDGTIVIHMEIEDETLGADEHKGACAAVQGSALQTMEAPDAALFDLLRSMWQIIVDMPKSPK